MQGHCHQCGDQEFRVESDTTFRLGIPWLSSFFWREIKLTCTGCGEERSRRMQTINLSTSVPTLSLDLPKSNVEALHKEVMTWGRRTETEMIGTDYPAVFREGENLLVPTFEGRVQDATSIDRYGDADLMAGFAEEYLRQFWTLMPTARFPASLKEIMPPLLLLVVSVEQAIKAFLIRSEQHTKGHSLPALYQLINSEHRQAISRHFASSELCVALSRFGVDHPTVESLLESYAATYGGESSVYMDVRYYAEPTIASHRGHNLVKGSTPYPVFLPYVARALLDVYRLYSGAERLRRLGGDVQGSFRDGGKDNHGDWGIIPWTMDITVISVPQRAGMDARDNDLLVYETFKESHPPILLADWMYGGNTLLFYQGEWSELADGTQEVEGLPCRVWRDNRLGMHSRDLHRLADALEAGESSGDSQ